MHKITPFLWYNGQLDEAITLYTSVFRNSKVLSTSSRYSDIRVFVCFILRHSQGTA
jgi:predicted 3-demethylubiquinone-9 3-methyltransferase (glyoxalase superfamily)